GVGHVLAIVEPSPWRERGSRPRLVAWAEVTRLAIDAHVDGDHVVAFASDLATGKAAAGVALELQRSAIRARTDAHGLALLPLAPQAARYLLARRGDDT